MFHVRRVHMLLLPLVVCLSLSACGPRDKAGVDDKKKTDDKVALPFLKITDQKVNGDEREWSLQATGIKQLTARVYVVAGGEALTGYEVVCNWQEWPKDQADAKVRMVFAVADKVDDKSLFVTLAHPQSPPNKTNVSFEQDVTVKRLMKGKVWVAHKDVTESAGIESSREVLVCWTVFRDAKEKPDPKLDTIDLKGLAPFDFKHMASFIEASKAGRTIVAVSLQWKKVGEE